MAKRKTISNLKVSGYLSLALAILILIFVDFWQAIPFLLNYWLVAKYFKSRFETEGAVAFAILMLALNGIALSLPDVIVWIYFVYSWYKK